MIPERILGPHEQLAYLKVYWPDFRCRVNAGTLTAIGELSPSPISQTYTVRIAQKSGRIPEVQVITPELEKSKDGTNIPHMYAQEKLCLFRPGANEWRMSMPIATTIVPWTSMWLCFYESWHATGEWQGGGVHPEMPMGTGVSHEC